jgi:hypothetical protein
MNDELAFTMEEATTRSFEADLVADDVPITGDVLSTLTLTLRQAYTREVINSRDDMNVLNTNGVTVDSAGHLIWSVSVEDSTILNRSLWQEPRRCLFKWTYPSAAETKAGSFEFLIWVTRNAAA